MGRSGPGVAIFEVVGNGKAAMAPRGARLRSLSFGLLLAAALGVAVPAASLALGSSRSAPRAASSGSGSGLHVVPFPGTPDAAPGTDIIFSALAPSDLRSVSVVGSRTGAHAGHVSVLPAHGGAAFTPDRPFAPGERVEVRATLASPAVGTASGDPGSTRLNFSFGVARTAEQPPSASPAAAHGRGNHGPTQHFHSTIGFHPPVVDVTGNPDGQSGYMFLTPNHSPQVGPMILDSQGHLVWFEHLRGSAAYNMALAHYRGQPVLTWFQFRPHTMIGQDVIVDRHYHTLATLQAAHGYNTDVHEFQVTPQGTAYLVALHVVGYNESSVGGPSNGHVVDNVIQELDVKTGKLIWEWHALGHIPLTASYNRPRGGSNWSYFHLNSIQRLSDGNLLISARNTWGVYEISRSTGKVIWTLGGKHSSFRMGKGTNFEWQHDARLLGGGVMTLFDDAATPQEELESSVKTLRLNFQARTATLVRRYTHSPPLLASRAGNAQALPNRNMFVGWGNSSTFSEYSARGRQIFNGRFALGVYSYRAYRFPWSATPPTRPSLALSPQSNGSVRVYASWNGDTHVARWRVLGGGSPKTLHWFDTTPRHGFETAMTLHSEPRYVVVQALGPGGHVIGTSHAHAEPRHLAIFGPNAFVSSSNGAGTLPVGCFTGHNCTVTLTLTSGRSVVAQARSESIHAGRGASVPFTLSAAGRRQLSHSSHHRLEVAATVQDSSGVRATKSVTLIPFSVSGPAPPQHANQTPIVQLASTRVFVSSGGRAGITSGCYGPSPCHIRATISSGGVVIGTTSKSQHLGANELGNVYLELNATGRTMLRAATGNQLGAQVKLTDGNATATGDIDLISYR
ncbi:MAG: arylsulfotransferase family protein [Solirubrobacteraceae bacterium]